ncbi:hypothetical protein BCR42DRAFT_429131 [Absidia repens]|uniref:Uncharacterized protein n=1 Tax=Absidia repens TaxID=90262 RepID=A0A1X2HXU0_9FUNG|nr:hypothetical protein BCR42DRAFT_429131 [Absidia repens]
MNWTLTKEEQNCYHQEMVNIKKEEYFDLYFLEKQAQIQRFHVLDNDLVPKYYEKLMSFLRIQTKHFGTGERRVIRDHVKQKDQWLNDGGPSLGGLWDVNDDLELSKLLGWDEIITWAMKEDA